MTRDKVPFCFNKKNTELAQNIVQKYPKGRQRSAVLPLLDIAQRQNGGWLSRSVIEYIADYISEPYIRVYEVASFYTMYNLKPVGRYHIQICGTTPCWLRGSDSIMNTCENLTETKCGSTSSDNMFTISETECLGACINAPVIAINDDYYEKLNTKKLEKILLNLKLDK